MSPQTFGQMLVCIVMRVFLDEINIWISELRVKQIALHDVNGNHLVN